MSYLRSKVVEQIQAWLGCNEADGSHKKIIDIYNSHKPLARGYAVRYTDEWCATTVSAVAVNLGYTAIIPTECSCSKMIELLKKIDSWQESDSYVPQPGDIMFYDWDDNGIGENTNNPEHVGIVEKVSGNTITVIEGNYKNAVTRRDIAVNGKYIRGFGVPKYGTEPVKPAAKTETTTYTLKQFVKDVQKACGASVDGVAGPETLSKTVTLSANKNARHAAVRAVQKRLTALGYTEVGTVDGVAGAKFTAAVKHFQKDNGCIADGEITAKMTTWEKLLCIGLVAKAPVEEGYTLKQFVKDVQKACGASVDGIPGPETLSKTVTLSSKKNNKHAAVKAVQKRLAVLGYTEIGAADGIAGPKFTSAVAHFQQDNNCAVDGEITAKNTTWKKLLGMA